MLLLVSLALLLGLSPCWAHNGKLAVAMPVEGIVVDGDLSEWPPGLPEQPVAIVEHGMPATGPQDCRAGFRVAYDQSRRALYVAVEVRDDVWVREPATGASWDTQDGCEVYLDLLHARTESPASQHMSYGMRQSQSGSGRSAAGAWRYTAGRHTYEWRLDLRESKAGPGDVVGFDVVVADRDADGSL